MHPPLAKRGELKKNLALVARFQKLRGDLTSRGGGGPEFSEGEGELNSQRGLDSPRATMFFCKHVNSLATLLLIIQITMYILISSDIAESLTQNNHSPI